MSQSKVKKETFSLSDKQKQALKIAVEKADIGGEWFEHGEAMKRIKSRRQKLFD